MLYLLKERTKHGLGRYVDSRRDSSGEDKAVSIALRNGLQKLEQVCRKDDYRAVETGVQTIATISNWGNLAVSIEILIIES